jgi:asparagine synthase (glutamine-hydrolysing)
MMGGPDQQTVLKKRNWAIGNNRLAIMGLEGGTQPYALGDFIQVVFNGELYNHRELRRMLEERGYTFPDSCDGSILPAMYAEYGAEFVRYLDGMFAIAVIDLRDEVTLTLAVDSSGMKPLYYYWDAGSGTLYFASELPALMGFGTVPSRLWLQGVDFYLTTKSIFGERTMFEDVFVMAPSTMIRMRQGERPKQTSWTTLLVSEEPAGGLQEAGLQLLGLLQKEVESLLDADVPVSTINSGGLDSSFITAIAGLRKEGIHSFNIAYVGEWPFDEKAYAREVAERCGTIHHQVYLDPKHFPDVLPEVVRRLGQPNADPITLSSYALFEAVRQTGFKVALSGDAADEMFGGYDRFVESMNALGDWVKMYVESLGAVGGAMRSELYSDDYRTFIQENGAVSDMLEDHLRYSRAGRLDTMLAFERQYRLPSYHLRRVDHMSMAQSVEVRVPFCQPRIVDYAKRLGDAMRIRNGQVKRVLYKAADGWLPESILERKKQPFTLPIDAMMRTGMPLYRYAREVLEYDTLREQNIFNPEAVEKLLAVQAANPNSRTALAIWSLLIFQLWCAQYRVTMGSAKPYQFQEG